MPGDFLIIQHRMNPELYCDFSNYSPTVSLDSNNNDGDWFYDSASMLFSYISNVRCKSSETNIEIACDLTEHGRNSSVFLSDRAESLD